MARVLTPQAAQISTGQVMSEQDLRGAIAGGLALAAVDGSRVLAVGGIVEIWPGRGLVWGLLAEEIGASMVPIHATVKRVLACSTLPRIEAQVAASHEAGRRWAKLLGFQYEGTLRAFWQGHDYELYALVR